MLNGTRKLINSTSFEKIPQGNYERILYPR